MDYSLYDREVASKPINRTSDRISLDQIIRSVSVDGFQYVIFNFYLLFIYIMEFGSNRKLCYVPCSIVFIINYFTLLYDQLFNNCNL